MRVPKSSIGTTIGKQRRISGQNERVAGVLIGRDALVMHEVRHLSRLSLSSPETTVVRVYRDWTAFSFISAKQYSDWLEDLPQTCM